jgi:alpha-glucosidase
VSDAPTVRHPAPWWQGAVIYQVYPRSFADSNGDGVGDLVGIIAHLDHVAALGADAIWLSPIYPSPLHDVGYDITDYTDIAAEYGTLADLDALIAACHARGLRLLLDLVPCHTSVEHPWFAEARASRASARRDWYIWADPGADGGPPNNWVAAFGSSSWELDPPSGQYYLHSFYPEQPDLNWRNPAVATAIHDVMRFWFQRGVDGFRVDAIAHAIKDDQLRDNPPAVHGRTVFGIDASGHERLWNVERPEVHEVIRGMRAVSDGYPERVLIGEVYTPTEMLAGFLGHGRDDEFPLAFNFELLHSPWDAAAFRLAIERSEALTPAFTNPTYALSNHDQVRHATRYGPGAVRLAALLLLTLRGTITIYAGEEIGQEDAVDLPGPRWDRAGRDGQRTPMQWDATEQGGFTSGTPWLPVTDAATRNVAAQDADPRSILNLYRRLIALRRELPALRHGSQRSLLTLPDDLIGWTREAGDERLLILGNMGKAPASVTLPVVSGAEVVLGTDADRSNLVAGDEVRLAPNEGVLLRLRHAELAPGMREGRSA